MGLLLRLAVGGRAGVRTGQPAAQARVLGKFTLQPLEHDAGLGVAPESVECVRREPCTPEARGRLVRGWAGAGEEREGPRGVVPILEQRLCGPHLDRGIGWEALRGDLEQGRRVAGAARLLVEVGLLEKASQE